LGASTTGAATTGAAAGAVFFATDLGADFAEVEVEELIIPEAEEEEEDILRRLCSQNRGCRELILFSRPPLFLSRTANFVLLIEICRSS
jgi:hypothetical protein